MSNSFKKPYTGNVCWGHSEKQDKRLANRRLRRKMKRGEYDEIKPNVREVSNIRDFTKDGKADWTGSDYEERARRK